MTKTPEWTQTEWKYEPIEGYAYVVEIEKESQIFLIAGAVPPGREAEIRANMRLASKAPALYASLDEAINWIDLTLSEFRPEARERMLKTWRKVLAEARGETTDAPKA